MPNELTGRGVGIWLVSFRDLIVDLLGFQFKIKVDYDSTKSITNFPHPPQF
jgi:hypothetical protein